ncbi:MAG: uncharacterized protein KVP18_002801 [Porospora cf. gigantea A]|uniref:uncharacterized protein n=1 Tax=Porospora cf. gigantea A TaxID=2853593 RepID=UPI00355981F1|nr:MAG: hypothetical protein KVP18_002801 [Porospora cf. gigantea A]
MPGQQYPQPSYPQVRSQEISHSGGGMPVTPVQPPMVPIQSHFHQAPLQPDAFPSDPYHRAIPSDPHFHQAPVYYGHPPEPAYYGQEAFPTEPTHMAPFGGAPLRQGQYPCVTPDPQTDDDDETLNDLPLLEELGIRPAEIAARIQGVLFFRDVDLVVIQDVDIIGPMLMVVALGLCLLCVSGQSTAEYSQAKCNSATFMDWASWDPSASGLC